VSGLASTHNAAAGTYVVAKNFQQGRLGLLPGGVPYIEGVGVRFSDFCDLFVGNSNT